MKNAVIAGSFDPVTIGHMDLILRTADIFERVYVAVADNSEKKYMFDKSERIARLKNAVAKSSASDKIEVIDSEGLLCETAKRLGAVIVKGVRDNSDFEYEKYIAEINRDISGVDTLLITASPELSHINSKFVREMLKYGVDITRFIP